MKEHKDQKEFKDLKDIKDTKEQNLIKKTAKELGMTYKELGEAIGLSEASIRRLATSTEINKQVNKSIEMLLKIQELQSDLEDYYTIKRLLLK